MKKIFIPTNHPEDWKNLLAGTDKHWRDGFSAKALAEEWEQVNGDFPSDVRASLESSGIDRFLTVRLLLAFPEWKVQLPPRGHASQNDLFVLGKDASGDLFTLMVEGKVSETFGRRLQGWLSTPGRQQRLDFIQSKLGLASEIPSTIRYQLLHRTVSAVMEAECFNATSAIMLVHSFDENSKGFENYTEFLKLFDIENIEVGKLYLLTNSNGIDVYACWVNSK